MIENNGGKPTGQPERNGKQELTAPRDIARVEPSLENTSHEELVSGIRSMIEQERQDHDRWHMETYGQILVPFDAVRHMGSHLALKSQDQKNYGRNKRTLRDLEDAFGAISYAHIKLLENDSGQWKKRVHDDLLKRAREHGRFVHLEPREVRLLDAMAEALDIPRVRGEATVDLLQNIPTDQRQEIGGHHAPIPSEDKGATPAERKRGVTLRSLFRWLARKTPEPPLPAAPASDTLKSGFLEQVRRDRKDQIEGRDNANSQHKSPPDQK